MAHILLMERNEGRTPPLATSLKRLGYDVEVSGTPEKAIAKLLSQSFDLLIADLDMRIDGAATDDAGAQVINIVRDPRFRSVNASFSDIPILAVSQRSVNQQGAPMKAMAESMGATDFLERSASFARLRAAVSVSIALR